MINAPLTHVRAPKLWVSNNRALWNRAVHKKNFLFISVL